MRNAKNLLSTLGFNVKRVGSGTVYTQFPEQDEHMKIGGTIIIRGKARSFETRTLAKMNN
jgi:cell division protein FtsI (penicillin-binding protein 3)